MEEALADPEMTGSIHRSLLLTYLGEAHLLAGAPGRCGRRSPARPSTSRTCRRSAATRRGSCGYSATSPCTPTLPTWSQPRGHYTQALARANELEMRPLQAHCHLGLGKPFDRTGDRAKAVEHLTLTATMYCEMDTDFWLEKVKAELASPHNTLS